MKLEYLLIIIIISFIIFISFISNINNKSKCNILECVTNDTGNIS